MSNKQIEYKLYSVDGNFIQTILNEDITSDFSFSSSINSGQGELNITLNKTFGYDDIKKGMFIKVYVFSDDFPDGYLIYNGQINILKRLIEVGKNQIEITAIGLGSILNFGFYSNSGDYTFTKTDTASNIVKSILDDLIAKYSWFSYNAESIETTTDEVSVDFDYTTYYKALTTLSDLTGFKFYVNQDGLINFRDKEMLILWDDTEIWDDAEIWEESYTQKHIGTVGFDISRVQYKEDSEDIVNSYTLKRKSGTLDVIQDSESIITYGLREKYEENTDLSSESTALIYANNYLAENKDETIKLEITLNNKFILEKLNPMDLITILNIEYSISSLQINKIDYTTDSVKLYIESFDTLGKEIFT